MEAVGLILASSCSPSARPLEDPLPHVRSAVRALLLDSPGYQELPPDNRRALASAMVRVCHAAASLVREEVESRREVQSDPPTESHPVAEAQVLRDSAARPPARSQEPPGARIDHPSARRRPLAAAQSAGSDFSGVAASKVAGTTQAILNAISFPRFVTDLINGVFKAMLDSSAQQMNSFIELLNNVAASADGFADANMGADRARQWLVQKYPGSFEIQRDDADPDASPGDPPPASTLVLKDGGTMPSENALRTDLGLQDTDTVPSGDPDRTLVPLARARLAKMRQEMLASMVMMGMQRIVVDSGRISASMRFHIDTRSAAQDDQGSTFSEQNSISGSGSFGYGPWGASASMSNTIGYVSTERSQTTEEMNTSVDLNSSVEINFKSDYLPLNRLASPGQVDRIRANTRNPDAEAEQAAAKDRTAAAARNAASDQQRREALNSTLSPRSQTPAAAAPRPSAATPRPSGANTPAPPTTAKQMPTTTPQSPAVAAPPTIPAPAQHR